MERVRVVVSVQHQTFVDPIEVLRQVHIIPPNTVASRLKDGTYVAESIENYVEPTVISKQKYEAAIARITLLKYLMKQK